MKKKVLRLLYDQLVQSSKSNNEEIANITNKLIDAQNHHIEDMEARIHEKDAEIKRLTAEVDSLQKDLKEAKRKNSIVFDTGLFLLQLFLVVINFIQGTYLTSAVGDLTGVHSLIGLFSSLQSDKKNKFESFFQLWNLFIIALWTIMFLGKFSFVVVNWIFVANNVMNTIRMCVYAVRDIKGKEN